MAVTVVARWDPGWFGFEYGLLTEYSVWEQVLISYGVDRRIFVPKLMVSSTLEQYNTLDEALANVSGQKVFLEKAERAVEIGREPVFLKNFQHPKDAVYIFGNTPTDNSSWVEEDDVLLSIDIPYDGDMFGFTVVGIVLYDRSTKEA